MPVPGETITVESVDLTEQPGARARRSTLALRLLSSQGGNYPVQIPAGREDLQHCDQRRPQPIPSAGASLPLPIMPGEQRAEIVWESPIATGTVLRTSAVESTGARVQHRSQSRAADRSLAAVRRWPAAGPGDPVLGRDVRRDRRRLADLANPGAAADDARRRPARIRHEPRQSAEHDPRRRRGCCCCCVRRATQIDCSSFSVRSFQLIQILLALTSIAALIALAASVPMGLLGTPEMHIVGNGSSAYDYHWFQDQARKRCRARSSSRRRCGYTAS